MRDVSISEKFRKIEKKTLFSLEARRAHACEYVLQPQENNFVGNERKRAQAKGLSQSQDQKGNLRTKKRGYSQVSGEELSKEKKRNVAASSSEHKTSARNEFLRKKREEA